MAASTSTWPPTATSTQVQGGPTSSDGDNTLSAASFASRASTGSSASAFSISAPYGPKLVSEPSSPTNASMLNQAAGTPDTNGLVCSPASACSDALVSSCPQQAAAACTTPCAQRPCMAPTTPHPVGGLYSPAPSPQHPCTCPASNHTAPLPKLPNQKVFVPRSTSNEMCSLPVPPGRLCRLPPPPSAAAGSDAALSFCSSSSIPHPSAVARHAAYASEGGAVPCGAHPAAPYGSLHTSNSSASFAGAHVPYGAVHASSASLARAASGASFSARRPTHDARCGVSLAALRRFLDRDVLGVGLMGCGAAGCSGASNTSGTNGCIAAAAQAAHAHTGRHMTTRQVVESVIGPMCSAHRVVRYADILAGALPLGASQPPSAASSTSQLHALAALHPLHGIAAHAPSASGGCLCAAPARSSAAALSCSGAIAAAAQCAAPAAPPAAPAPPAVAPPDYYVSHAWDVCFADMARAVLRHFEGCDEQQVYVWMDIFATDVQRRPGRAPAAAAAQHGHGSQLGLARCGSSRGMALDQLAVFDHADMASQEARAAMRATRATLLVLDPACVPLRRTWCLWEACITLANKGPSGLICLQASPPDAAPDAKLQPSLDAINGICLASSETSVPADKQALLHDLGPRRRRTSTEAPYSHHCGPPAASTGSSFAAFAGTGMLGSADSFGSLGDLQAEHDGRRGAASHAEAEARLALALLLRPLGYHRDLAGQRVRPALVQEDAPAAVAAAMCAGADGSGAGGGAWDWEPLWRVLLRDDEELPRAALISACKGGGASTLAAALCSLGHSPSHSALSGHMGHAAHHLMHHHHHLMHHHHHHGGHLPGFIDAAGHCHLSPRHPHAALQQQQPAAAGGPPAAASGGSGSASRLQHPSGLRCGSGTLAAQPHPFASFSSPHRPQVHAYHLCSHDDARRQDPFTVVASLSYQLACRFKAFREALLAALAQPAPCYVSDPAAAGHAAQQPGTSVPPALGWAVHQQLLQPLDALLQQWSEQHSTPPFIVLLLDSADEPGPLLPVGPPAVAGGAGSGGGCAAAEPRHALQHPAASGRSVSAGGGAPQQQLPLAPLLRLLLQRLPRCVRLILTASAQRAAPLLQLLHCPPAGLAPGAPLVPPPPSQDIMLLDVAELRDNSALVAGLQQQLVLRAGPEDGAALAEAMLAHGHNNLLYYTVCLQLLALTPATLPATLEGALAAVFDQAWAQLADDTEREQVRHLLALLAVAQEPLPAHLLGGMGLAAAAPLLPAWGVLFREGWDHSVSIAHAMVAEWLRGAAGAAAGAGTWGVDAAAGHAMLAQHLYDTLEEGRPLGAYGVRYLLHHLAAAIAAHASVPRPVVMRMWVEQVVRDAGFLAQVKRDAYTLRAVRRQAALLAVVGCAPSGSALKAALE